MFKEKDTRLQLKSTNLKKRTDPFLIKLKSVLFFVVKTRLLTKV